MRLAERIEKKLTERFTPVRLRVIDESHEHAGHVGWRRDHHGGLRRSKPHHAAAHGLRGFGRGAGRGGPRAAARDPGAGGDGEATGARKWRIGAA